MSASEQSNTQQDASRRGDALADMQERLAQFGRLVGQVRDGLPEQHAQALSRIEQEIGSLTERIVAFGADGQRLERGGSPSAAAAPTEADDPWDPQSAEALMRAYESAEVEFTDAGQQGEGLRNRQRPQETEAAAPQARPAYDPAWLEARFADIAALLQRALADADPARSLAALDRRLDQFERRLDSALGDLASGPDHEGLKLIDGHVAELAGHVEAIRKQLGRLDAMDGQLCELARTLEDGQQPRAGFAPLSEDAVAALIDTAAEHAASRIAASLPTEAGDQGRIDALEALLQDYIAERRRSDEVSASILHTIEDALIRIVDRVEAMEAAKSAVAAPADSDAAERDGMEADRDRLAEAYAAGARVLGQQALVPSLHAADYSAAEQQGERVAAAEPLPQLVAEELVAQDDQTRQELRASAMRAKLKAQAAQQEPAAEGAGLDEAELGTLGHGRARTWTSAKAGSHRSSLLLGAAVAVLFGAGFVAVDSFLAGKPPKGLQQRTLEAQPAAETGNNDRAQPASDWKNQPATIPQTAPNRTAPEAATPDPGRTQDSRAQRLYRLQTGTMAMTPTGALPGMPSPQDEAGASPAGSDGTRTGAGDEIPSAIGTVRLRQAAAAGEAFAQFEIATRFAEGKGVAQDHKQAFAWYERAASRGLASAQFRLAAYFEHGVGVEADKERAKVWYGRAAEQGFVRAMHNLGVLTIGTGERQADYATAARWFGQAAERGLADSQFNLGVLHENGRGVPRDLQEAYKWFALAARSGDPAAARRLEQVRVRLAPAELEAAEQKLAAWRPVATEPVTGSIGTRASR